MVKWQRVGGTPIQMVRTSVFMAIGAAATLGTLSDQGAQRALRELRAAQQKWSR
jgi:hypothetical protein